MSQAAESVNYIKFIIPAFFSRSAKRSSHFNNIINVLNDPTIKFTLSLQQAIDAVITDSMYEGRGNRG